MKIIAQQKAMKPTAFTPSVTFDFPDKNAIIDIHTEGSTMFSLDIEGEHVKLFRFGVGKENKVIFDSQKS